jgi:outer membrane assembly lipoprotein YfiO
MFMTVLAAGAGMPVPAARAAQPSALQPSTPQPAAAEALPGTRSTAPDAGGSKSWEFGGRGQWSPVPGAATQRAVANPTLDKAEQLLAGGRASDAEDVLVAWVKTPGNQAAADRDRALFLLSDAYYRGGDRLRAFLQLDELLDTYPESRFFNPALERQYQIADGYLNGYKDKLLGMRILSQDDKAIDMLFRVRERSPGSPLAERALLRTADFYFADAQFDFAADAYAAFARAYPRSPEMPKVKLRQALSSLAQFHGTKFDATPLLDARAQFEDLKVQHADTAEQAGVPKFNDTINRTLARKLLGTADWYRRTDKPKAAAYTLQTLVATYPRTAEADQARAELAKLPQAVVEQAGRVRTMGSEVGPSAPLGPPAPAATKPRS